MNNARLLHCPYCSSNPAVQDFYTFNFHEWKLHMQDCQSIYEREKPNPEVEKQQETNPFAWDTTLPPRWRGPVITDYLKEQAEKFGLDNDPVEHPSHYSVYSPETIDYIANRLDSVDSLLTPYQSWLWGQIMRYIDRWPHKNEEEDLKKARWYIDELLENLQE